MLFHAFPFSILLIPFPSFSILFLVVFNSFPSVSFCFRLFPYFSILFPHIILEVRSVPLQQHRSLLLHWPSLLRSRCSLMSQNGSYGNVLWNLGFLVPCVRSIGGNRREAAHGGSLFHRSMKVIHGHRRSLCHPCHPNLSIL